MSDFSLIRSFDIEHRGFPKRRMSNPNGFTLIELLAVTVVIATLAALILGSLQTMQSRVQGSKCASNLHTLISAVQLYAADSNGALPPCYFNDGITSSRQWYSYLQDGSVQNYQNGGVLPNANLRGSPNVLTVYNCPANPNRIDTGWKYPSYAYNRALGYVNISPGSYSKLAKLSSLDQPQKTVVFADSNIRSSSGVSIQVGPPSILYYWTRSADWSVTVNFSLHPGGRANLAMADGHVESVTKPEVSQRFTDKNLLWTRNNDTSDPSSVW